jgi:hypothetical protein
MDNKIQRFTLSVVLAISTLTWADPSVGPQTQPQTQTDHGGGSITNIIGTSVFNDDGGLKDPDAFIEESYGDNIQKGLENGTIPYPSGREEVASQIRDGLTHTQLNQGDDPKVVALLGDARSGRTFSIYQYILTCLECKIVRIKADLIMQIKGKENQAQAVKALLVYLSDKAKLQTRGRLIAYIDNVALLNMGDGLTRPADAISETIASKKAPDMILEVDKSTNDAVLQKAAVVSDRVTVVQQPNATRDALLAQLRDFKPRF